MKLLEELNQIIAEADKTSLEISGYDVSIYDIDARHNYYSPKLLYRATRDEPEEWGDSESKNLQIKEIKFEINHKNQSYVVEYDLKGNDFHDDESGLITTIKVTRPKIYDMDEELVTDPQTIAILRSVCLKYVEKFDIMEYLYTNATQRDVGENYNDNGYDYDDDEVVPQYYDGH